MPATAKPRPSSSNERAESDQTNASTKPSGVMTPSPRRYTNTGLVPDRRACRQRMLKERLTVAAFHGNGRFGIVNQWLTQQPWDAGGGRDTAGSAVSW